MSIKYKFNPLSKKFDIVQDTSLLTLKGVVDTTGNLPLTSNSENDLYIVKADDRLYTWNKTDPDGILSDWVDVGTISSIDWNVITNKPTSAVGDIDDAVTKKHTINDQASSGYVDIGTMRIQWGSITYNSDLPVAMVLPAPFANLGYSVQLSLHAWEYNAEKGPANVSNGISVVVKTTTAFHVNRDDDLALDTVFDWFAIGLKP